jgi:hypothetical protein
MWTFENVKNEPTSHAFTLVRILLYVIFNFKKF